MIIIMIGKVWIVSSTKVIEKHPQIKHHVNVSCYVAQTSNDFHSSTHLMGFTSAVAGHNRDGFITQEQLAIHLQVIVDIEGVPPGQTEQGGLFQGALVCCAWDGWSGQHTQNDKRHGQRFNRCPRSHVGVLKKKRRGYWMLKEAWNQFTEHMTQNFKRR